MKEYRAQLDADRAKRLSKGTNNSHLRVKADDMKSKVRHILHSPTSTYILRVHFTMQLSLAVQT